jgi:hypothetical protein
MMKVIVPFPSKNGINTVELSPSETASCAAIQKFPNIFGAPRVIACSKQPPTGAYPEKYRSSLYHPIIFI